MTNLEYILKTPTLKEDIFNKLYNVIEIACDEKLITCDNCPLDIVPEICAKNVVKKFLNEEKTMEVL